MSDGQCWVSLIDWPGENARLADSTQSNSSASLSHRRRGNERGDERSHSRSETIDTMMLADNRSMELQR
jgi:hypothetical protein